MEKTVWRSPQSWEPPEMGQDELQLAPERLVSRGSLFKNNNNK